MRKTGRPKARHPKDERFHIASRVRRDTDLVRGANSAFLATLSEPPKSGEIGDHQGPSAGWLRSRVPALGRVTPGRDDAMGVNALFDLRGDIPEGPSGVRRPVHRPHGEAIGEEAFGPTSL
jgi:hypothetical protein